MRRHLPTLAKYLFAALVLTYLWRSGHLEVSQISQVFTLKMIVQLSLVLFLALSFNFMRFYLIMRSQQLGIATFTLWRVFWMGLFFNFMLPGGTGGDLVKGYYLMKGREDRKTNLFGAIVYDRFVGMYGMLLMAVIAMLMRPAELIAQKDLQILFIFIVSIWAGFTLLSITMMFERIRNSRGKRSILGPILIWKWQKKLHDLMINLFQLRIFALAVLLTLCCQGLIIYFLILSGRAAGGGDIDSMIYFIVGPIGFMIMAVPVSPGGLGVGQAAFNVLYKVYTGVTSPVMVTAVTVYQIFTLLEGLLGLYYYLRGWDRSTSRSTTPAKG